MDLNLEESWIDDRKKQKNISSRHHDYPIFMYANILKWKMLSCTRETRNLITGGGN